MIETIILDNGIEYMIVEEEKINDTTYTLFSNINDPEDICFRKTSIKNNEEYYIGLDNEEELKMVLNYFAKKKLKIDE